MARVQEGSVQVSTNQQPQQSIPLGDDPGHKNGNHGGPGQTGDYGEGKPGTTSMKMKEMHEMNKSKIPQPPRDDPGHNGGSQGHRGKTGSYGEEKQSTSSMKETNGMSKSEIPLPLANSRNEDPHRSNLSNGGSALPKESSSETTEIGTTHRPCTTW